MNVTRDVIQDLWPLYRSGEASPDTLRLVEDFLRQDPEFAHVAREESDPSMTAKWASLPRRESDLDLLRRTKRLVRIREGLFWGAFFLSLTPLSVYHTSWGSGWLIRDLPGVALGLGASAALLWGGYLMLRRRLSATGL